MTQFNNKITVEGGMTIHRLHRRLSLTTDKFSPDASRFKQEYVYRWTAGFPDEFAHGLPKIMYFDITRKC